MLTQREKAGELTLLANQQAEEKKFWMDLFSGDWNRSHIPYDNRTDDNNYAYSQGSYRCRFSPSLSQGLSRMASSSDYALHVIMMSGVFALVQKFSSTELLTVGTLVYKSAPSREVNRLLPVRVALSRKDTLKDILGYTRERLGLAVKNQVFPVDRLPVLLQMTESARKCPLLDILVLVSTIHDPKDAEEYELPLVFDIGKDGNDLYCSITYNSLLYTEVTIGRLAGCLQRLLEDWIQHPDKAVADVDLLSEEDRKQMLAELNDTDAAYPSAATIPELFGRQVHLHPDRIALSFQDHAVTYGWLNEKADKVAGYLQARITTAPDTLVGILMTRSIDTIVAIMGILKAGAAYVPVEPTQPEDRIRGIINDAKLGLVISESRFIGLLNRLQWECESFRYFLCMDTGNVAETEESEQNRLMDKELWEYVGETATDDITAGGWKSSYTGLPIGGDEMEEYGENILQKLSPYITKDSRILEIGCASGLSMFRLAPLCGYYLGTDISSTVIARNRARIEKEGIENIRLEVLAAHELDRIDESGFDIVIMNSVVQHFHGHNYFRKVIRKCLGLLNDKALIFVGDVMDLEKKESLIDDMLKFREADQARQYTTKTDWSAELFLPKAFFDDLRNDCELLADVQYSGKLFSRENELTKFRYDALIKVDKSGVAIRSSAKKHQDDLSSMKDERKDITIGADDLAYVIYTSGTTGRPKGALITHRNVVRLLFNDRSLFDFGERDIWTMFHSYAFDFSVWEMYGALLKGGRLVLVSHSDSRDTDAFLDIVQKQKVTVLNQTPSAFQALISRQEVKNTRLSLRYVILGGEAMHPAALLKWKELHPSVRLINMYGITETTVHVTYKELTVEDLVRGSNNIGRPIPTLRTYVLDPGMRLLPVGAIGELFVEGEGVGRGYLGQEVLTNTKFIPSPFRRGQRMYRSGDMARWLANGELEYLGRNDRQVKIRGFRIEPGEIENQLLRCAKVQQAYIHLRENPDRDKYLIAYYVSTGVADLRKELASLLPDYMIPAFFVRMDSFPLTINGKINTAALPDPVLAADERFVPAADPVESRLVEIWSEVLGNRKLPIGVIDNFFQMGGHSLKATMLVSSILKHFSVKIPLANIFRAPTIRAMAEEIRNSGISSQDRIPHVPQQPYYALSSGQKRLFILDNLGDRLGAYHIPMILKIAPAPDIGKLELAFRKVIARHESLRSKFLIVDQQPVQKVLEDLNFRIEEIAGQDRTASELLAEITRPFDLSSPPLLRVARAMSTDHGEIILVDMHHIIADGVSLTILQKELLALYNGEQLPALVYQYKDYAAWQIGNSLSTRNASFWEKKFKDGVPVLELPYDLPRPAVRSSEGDHLVFSVEGPDMQLLYEMARRYECTLFMVLLAVYTVWLHKLSGASDIVVGTPVSGRDRDDFNSLIGVFINTLPLRNSFSDEELFSSFLLRVRDSVLEAFDHGEYPYEKIIESAPVVRDTARNSLFDVMLILQNWQDSGWNKGDNRIESIPFERKVSKLDIILEVFETEGSLQCRLEYCTALFHRRTMLHLIRYFKNIIRSLAGNATVRIKDIGLLDEGERRLLLEGYNSTEERFAQEGTIVELFGSQCAKWPDRIAVVFEGHQLSWRELDRRSDGLSSALVGAGVLPGTIVAVLLERSAELMIAILGILKAGGAYLPIDPGLPRERIRYMLEDSNAGMVIVSRPGCWELEEGPGLPELYMEEYGEWGERPVVRAASGGLAYVIYTSGSTGRPKGVLIDHRSLMNRLNWMQRYYGLGKGDTVLQKTPVSFDVSVWELFLWILGGSRLCLLLPGGEKDPEAIIGTVSREGVTMLHFVPSMLSVFLEYVRRSGSGEELKSLLYVVASGESLTQKLAEEFGSVLGGAGLYNLYGPTEATVDVSYFDTGELKAVGGGRVPIGRPISNTRLYVVTGRGEVQGLGLSGELWISGAGVGRGYLNKVEQTAERFWADPFKKGDRIYRTGDQARWDEQGYLYFEGRKDNQVKIRGYRIELEEITYHLLRQPEVREAVVVTLQDEQGEQYLCGYYVAGAAIVWEELVRRLEAVLPPYMVPSRWMALDVFPLTPNGKVDRKALPAPGAVLKMEEPAADHPRLNEEILIELWRAVLGKSDIRVSSNFFFLGGDSIKSIQLQSRLIERGYQIDAVDIHRYPVLREMARKLKKKNRRAEQGIITGEVPLTPIQRRFFMTAASGPAHHYNQAVLLHSPAGFEEEEVKKVFSFLQEHHDALRIRFATDDSGNIVQYNHDAGLPLSLTVTDLRTSSPDAPAFGDRLDLLQRSISLDTGSLMRLQLIRANNGDYLQIVIHHLVVDVVSWRILLEDADHLFDQVTRGATLTLPLKTDSFKYWSERLAAYSAGGQPADRISYWTKNQRQTFSLLPKKNTDPGPRKYGDFLTESVSLDEELTTDLLERCNLAFHTKVSDLLLTALSMTMYRLFDTACFALWMEGHGREEIEKEIDISRTVGWFTTLYPAMIRMHHPHDLSRQLIEIKDQFNRVPAKGFDYGLLRYGMYSQFSSRLSFRRDPEIIFNFLGQIDPGTGYKHFSVDLSAGRSISPDFPLGHVLEISAAVSAHRLHITITYDHSCFEKATIARLLTIYDEQLQQLAEVCLRQETRVTTATDFTYKGLSFADLETISKLYDKKK